MQLPPDLIERLRREVNWSAPRLRSGGTRSSGMILCTMSATVTTPAARTAWCVDRSQTSHRRTDRSKQFSIRRLRFGVEGVRCRVAHQMQYF
jgi:hypothetical protein